MSLSAYEQYLLELINRGRLDPVAEAARYGIDLNEGLAPGTISTAAKQVLAPNAALEQAARGHSQWMLDADVFSHTGAGGSSSTDRIRAAGYDLSRGWSLAENISWSGTTGTLDLKTALESQHANLFRSAAHRTNTFAGAMQEIGLAQIEGQFTHQNSAGVTRTYQASMITENFGRNGSDVFITGVAYHDRDGDAFYSPGEGLAGVDFTSGAATTVSAAAGGYALTVAAGVAAAPAVLDIRHGAAVQATLTLDLRDGNAKVDLIRAGDGTWSLGLSASAVLGDGTVQEARLLGVAGLSLTGSESDNRLIGNAGDNSLYGGGGNDVLFGGAGDDRLYGGAGADHLDGGAGRNTLDGGLGNDRYVIRSAHDVIEGEVGYAQGGGIDTVEAWISYTLPTNIEILRLQGTANLTGTGGWAPEALVGNTGNNVLDGGHGNDVLNGKAGDDTLIGGMGADSLVGEAGADVFLFRSIEESRPGQENRDFINGFFRAEGDRIDLSQIDANTTQAGNQAFTFVGTRAFSGTAGELRWFTWGNGNFNIVQADTNGDRQADMEIFVNLTHTMVGSDFIL